MARLICRRLLLSGCSLSLRARMSTAATESSPIKIKESSSSPPWLMLPPSFTGDINYDKFYSLAESRVITRPQSKGLISDLMIPDLRVRGSSHGWLALFNPHTFDLFLYNPISHRHINLPPIPHNLPDDYEHRTVEKVILSCSPDDDERDCRAVMIYNNISSLAFCCPGRSKKWTTIGNKHIWDDLKGERLGQGYDDIVYSPTQKLLFSLIEPC